MPLFRATVGTAAGERLTITREARSAEVLGAELAGRGLFPIDVQRIRGQGWSQIPFIGSRFTKEDLLEWTRSLNSLIDAGLPVFQAFEIMRDDEEDPAKRRLIENLLHDLAYGSPLSEALGKHPEVFPDYFVKSVQAAERTGSLSTTLKELANVIRRRERIKRKIISAVSYPAFLVVLSTVIISGMVFWGMPQMERIFSNMGVDLPADTMMLLAAGAWLRDPMHLFFIVLGLTPTAYLIHQVSCTDAAKHAIHSYRYTTPVIGEMFHNADLAFVARTIAALISSGVPANDALSMTRETVENIVLKERMKETITRIERGENLAAAARQSGFLTGKLGRILRVGEESGSLSKSFTELADYCEERLDVGTEVFFGVIQQLSVIVMGLFIMVSLITMIRPMLEAISKI